MITNQKQKNKKPTLPKARQALLSLEQLPNIQKLIKALGFVNVSDQTQAQVVIAAFEAMDYNAINRLLSNDITYQEWPKEDFIKVLFFAFFIFQKKGSTRLVTSPGHCDGCTRNAGGLRFRGNNTRDESFMDILFIHENGVIKDIYECNQFCAYSSEKAGIRIALADLHSLLEEQKKCMDKTHS
ncbi:MAG: hypothetical protein JSR97_13275 [Verrucomicrobia bacterium]|nr:hypothetical protein [Verrucomicrobiota bacterium]